MLNIYSILLSLSINQYLMKLKLILFILLIQGVNSYSQSDVKFLKAFTNDIILDKNYAKYKDYIEYFNGYDSINEDYEKYTKEIFKLYFAEKNIPKTNRNIKVINVTNKDSLLNEKLDLVKNVKHSYYLIYNNNEYSNAGVIRKMVFNITNISSTIHERKSNSRFCSICIPSS